MLAVDRTGWLARRALPRLLFSGVFERYPTLKLVLTEQNGDWWTSTMREFDSAYATFGRPIRDRVPRWPSEYCASHVFIGASYVAPFEASAAVEGHNVMWGSDYPHMEGTFQHGAGQGPESITHQSLRHAFHAIDDDSTERMISANAIACYGFDADALASIARRIAAPTLAELSVPPERIPDGLKSLGFRTIGPFG
jgi:predicted TIM-barrel fold metal-dependent hydrolase